MSKNKFKQDLDQESQCSTKKNFKNIKDAILYLLGALIGSLLYALYIVGGLRCLLIGLAIELLLCVAFFFIFEP